MVITACTGSFVGSTEKECDQELACPPSLVCNLEVGRCSTPFAAVDSVRVHLTWEEDGVPALYTELWTAADFAEPQMNRTLDEMALARGRVREILTNDQISSSLLASSIDIRPVESEHPFAPHISMKSLGGAGTFGDGFHVLLRPNVPHLVQVHPNQIDLPLNRQLVTLPDATDQVVEVIIQGLSKLVPIHARLLKEDGSPLAFAWAHIEDASGTPVSGKSTVVEDGNVTLNLKPEALDPLTLVLTGLDGVPGGSYRLALDPIEITSETESVDLEDIVVDIKTPGLLRVVVLPTNPEPNEPLTMSFVSAVRISPGVVQVVEKVSDDTGLAVFELLQPGLYVVTALPHPNLPYRMATQAIWVQEGSQTTATINCGTRTRITGVIRNGVGQPLSGFRVDDSAPVSLGALGELEILRSSTDITNEIGRYSVQAGAGVHHLVIRPTKPELSPPTAFKTEVANESGQSQRTLDLTASLPFVRKVRFLRHDGTPLAGAQLSINWDNEEAPNGYLQSYTSTDEDGVAVIALPGALATP